jgi:hypothetical protein
MAEADTMLVGTQKRARYGSTSLNCNKTQQEKLTLKSLATRSSTTWLPMKPRPPVTSTVGWPLDGLATAVALRLSARLSDVR